MQQLTNLYQASSYGGTQDFESISKKKIIIIGIYIALYKEHST